MKEWKPSYYTSVIRCDSGDLLLYNSFMGAIAQIPRHLAKDIERFLQQRVTEADMSNRALEELCEGGFFVPSHLDERKMVAAVLDREREAIRFSMIILPHEDCNFRCVYCYEKFERGKMRADVVDGLELFVSHKVKEFKELRVSWFGGEPLLAQDVICELSDSFIDSCKQNNIDYASSMSTNGYLLTSDVADSLLERGIRGFQITLDGPESIHNNNRKLAGGGETYRKILDNLIGMRDRDEEFCVKIRVNFNSASIPSIQQWLVDEMGPLFADDPRFTMGFHPIGKWGGPNDSILDVCDPHLVSPIKYAFIEKSVLLGFSDRIARQYLMPHGHVCYAGNRSSIVVGSDGTVYKCTKGFDEPRNTVGCLASDGQLIIDETLLNMWTKLDDKDTNRCSSCLFFPCCQGRNCPLDTMDQNRPLCPLTRTECETLVKAIALRRGQISS